MNNFTHSAQKFWAGVPAEERVRILNSVWCMRCKVTTGMVNITGKVSGGDLVLDGNCERCGHAVGRVVEKG